MNHLANSTSPYLLQHAHNPVDWYPWGEEALAKAKAEDKPIFLSIGYAACHWCHVMAHESFEDPETAAIINDHFVCIKVDREERPDLDSIYMQATQAMTGSGGWPMSVFLTSDLRPFYTGTYFPPVRRYNMPSFKEVLLSLARAWREERAEIDRVGGQVVQHIQPLTGITTGNTFTQATLEAMSKSILGAYDWSYGGWGDAPKFPQPMTIEFLLRRAAEDLPMNEEILKAALHALKSMARGGMYDVVGGGFARYSTDTTWRVPHFEKMLYDNAQLARAYLHAWQITREPFYKHIVIETLNFIRRELTHQDGGFYSSLDADSEGEEGKFYVWTKEEIRDVIVDDSEFEFFVAAYGITDKGNWEGKTILQRTLDDASLAARFKIDAKSVADTLASCHSKLLARRNQRIRPGTDDKVLTAWNGLMLQTFAEAARYLDDESKSNEYRLTAIRNADFLLTALRPSGQLRRAWRDGLVTNEVFLEDYAALINGLLELYQTDFNNRWFAAAQELADEMMARFSDSSGGFFDTPSDGETLLVRPKDIQDNATPSGNALACEALLKMAAFTDKGEYRDSAETALGLVSDAAMSYPLAFARWLSAADYALSSGKQIAILYQTGKEFAQGMLDVIHAEFRPNIVVAASTYPPQNGAPGLLTDRPLKDGQTTAYVCEHFVCKQPVNTVEELQTQV
ncbi:MAG TPA: thioredoxin domain-containing protein [Anaerolineales bacterium]|jgi:uncharacterized protein YyaL (SSP411 family)|nr:thioredoxin domain-containing protein [Anaerolineales bacterium]